MLKPFIVWAISCLIFNFLFISSNVIPFTETNALIRLVFLIILAFVGIFSFFLFLHRYSKRYHNFWAGVIAIILIIGYFISLGTISEASQLLTNKQTVEPLENSGNEISPTPFIWPTVEPVEVAQPQTNQIDCVGPDNKIFKTTMTECEKLNRDWGKDVNYMVNCGIHEKCGGGSVWLSKSACNNTICCSYSNGSSIFLYDSSQCKSNTYTVPRVPPVYIPPVHDYVADYNNNAQKILDDLDKKMNSYPTYSPSKIESNYVAPTWPSIQEIKPTPVCVLLGGGQLVCQ